MILKQLRAFLIFALFFLTLPSYAMWGKIERVEYSNSKANWKTEHPNVIIALGYLEPRLVQHYSHYAKTKMRDRFSRMDSRIETQVIEYARGEDIVQALLNPNTIGLLFISHTYHSESTQTSIAVDADFKPLPHDILSAATPALLFAGIIGCHGPDVLSGYEVEYQFSKLPGHHSFYYTEDRYLSTNLLGIDNLKRALRKIQEDLRVNLPKLSPYATEEPETEPKAKLTLRVKDVIPYFEPRFVHVNGAIVGMLGASDSNSNHNRNYEDFHYSIPSYILTEETDPITVKVLSSELTPGTIADHYLLESATFETRTQKRTTSYLKPLHFGEEDKPQWRELGLDIVSLMDYLSAHSQHSSFAPCGSKAILQKTLAQAHAQHQKELLVSDRNSDVWENSIHRGRYYLETF